MARTSGFGASKPPERDPKQLEFHPIEIAEFGGDANQFGIQVAAQLGVQPEYRDYACGACGKATTGRLLCDVTRETDGAHVMWCICACEQKEPSIFVEKDGALLVQLPVTKDFHSDPTWPKGLTDLYDEAAKCYAAGAFTAASMVCRKLLMSCACHEQAKTSQPKEGESFAYYVDYIANSVLNFPIAKTPIDAIRQIGNDANHHVKFVTKREAERTMKIVHHMLDTIYVFPQV